MNFGKKRPSNVDGRRRKATPPEPSFFFVLVQLMNIQFVFGESFSLLSLTFRTELLPEFAIQTLRPS